MDYEKTAREIVRNLCGGWLPEEHVAYVADALRSASTPPEGWKLVPMEPDGRMLAAGDIENYPAGDIYRAMLSASPSPPEKG